MLFHRTVVVVVPAFREEALIAGVIETMPSFVDAIVVVDDGSPDKTSARAREAASRWQPLPPSNATARTVEILRHPVRRGVGAAIATGYERALRLTQHDHDVIAVMAGDGQMHPDDLMAVVRPVVGGAVDYVKGNRFGANGARQAMGTPRWVGGQVFSRLTAWAIGQPIDDSQCGYTAISRRALEQLDLTRFWPSFGYPNDLLGLLAAQGSSIAEVAVRPVYGNEVSKLRLRHLPPIFFLIARAAVRRQRSKASPQPPSNPRHPFGGDPRNVEQESCAGDATYHPEARP